MCGGTPPISTTRTVDNQVMKLRELEVDPGEARLSRRNRHGIGYKFVSGN